ncbi:DUF397 domain-containing protein [Streptomyces sp. NPDC059134]|uniref:DUF397 domain-containing protein n=1 Tax=Streptomyces sp. NPDC059134 TaxID=3346738 RepID=UPI0036A263D2
MSETDPLAQLTWRKSSYTGGSNGGGGECVETALLPDGRIAFRDSKRPDAAVLAFGHEEAASWLRHVKAAEPRGLAD